MIRFLSLSLLLACGSEAPEAEAPEAESPERETPERVETEDSDGPPLFDVHEWGLIDTTPDGFAVEIAAGPGTGAGAIVEAPPHGEPGGLRNTAGPFHGDVPVIGKPVLYFHVDDGVPDFDLNVAVELNDSLRVAEHFPPGVLSNYGHGLAWNVRLKRGPCGGARQYPSPRSSRCTSVGDGYCEAAELAGYETVDASCVLAGDDEWPLLFYRGGRHPEASSVLGLPLRVRRSEGTAVVERPEGAEARTIGRLWRLTRNGGGVRAAAVDWPAAGAETNVGNAAEGVDGARQAIRADLLSHGLTRPEAGAFENAWFEELFGVDGWNPSGETETDVLVYWIPQDDIETSARLRFEPPARSVRRAMMVRVDLAER